MTDFNITTPSTQVSLDANQHVTVPFTVENDSGRALDVQAQPVAVDGADVGWFSVVAPAVVHLDAGTPHTYQVDVSVPRSAQPGSYAFYIIASDVLDPDDRYADGPRVGFEVGATPGPVTVVDHGYPSTFLGALLGYLALGGAFGLTGLLLAFLADRAGNLTMLFVGLALIAVGVLITGPIGAGLGAFLLLRARHLEAPGWTGVAVGISQLVGPPLVLIGLLVLGRPVEPFLPRPVLGVLVTLVMLVAIVVPSQVGRGLVLLIRGKFAWPWVDIFRPRST